MDLQAIQRALRELKLDGWLFYDHHHRDPIAYRILEIPRAMCTRRWYYLIPAEAEPRKLAHRIERNVLAPLPGGQQLYAAWTEQHAALRRMLSGVRRIAMQYSPGNANPYIGLVDAGTVELVREMGAEVVSSADLVQQFEARWTPEALALHLEAGKAVHGAVRKAFGAIRDSIHRGEALDECGLQRMILHWFEEGGVESAEPPIVAVNAHSGDPHYAPSPSTSLPIRENDFVLLDVWAKRRAAGAVYFDITWTGFVGRETPPRYQEIFEIVRRARDAAVDYVKTAMQEGRPVRGYEVDDAARRVIAESGYGERFVHRTGHSIGEEIHGAGANMDNFETHDERILIPGTCFSIEPGIYLPEFGVRSEVDVYVEEHEARVTGEAQREIAPILA